MRWRYPRNREVRVRRRFCWVPLHVNGFAYWLERITVREEFISGIGWFVIDVIEAA